MEHHGRYGRRKIPWQVDPTVAAADGSLTGGDSTCCDDRDRESDDAATREGRPLCTLPTPCFMTPV